VKIGARLRFALMLGAIGCSRHPASCIGRSASPGPNAATSAEVAKILSVELPPEDAGDAAEADAYIEFVRREAWDEAAASIDSLPDAKKHKPTVRLVKGRVAMARGDYASAVQAFAALENDLAPIAEDIEKWRAEAEANVGPFPDAAQYFMKQGGAKGFARAALAFDKAGMADEARSAADKAIAAGRGDNNEIAVRALRARLAEAAGQTTTAADDLRFIVLHAPASDDAKTAQVTLEKLDPSHPLTGKERLSRADKLVESGRTDEALSEIDRAEKAPGAPDGDELSWARAFALYKSRGRYEKAALSFAKLGTKAGPRQAEALFYSARAQSRADHDDEAASGYRALARRFPASSFADEASYLAARLSFLHAAWVDASAGYSAYLRRFPNGKQRDSATYEHALSLLAAGKYASARGELHALSQSAGSPSEGARLRELEGLAAAKAGDKEGAVALWNDAIRSQPLSWAATVARARLAEEGATAPSMIDPADGKTSDALSLQLPPIARLYHRLGLDSDAEGYLRAHEHDAVLELKGREKEALCAMYAELGRAARLYRIGVEAVPAALLTRAPSAASEWGWRCLYPRPYLDRVRDIEAREGLPKSLIYAVMRQESGYDPDAVSGARAVGLLQVMPETARRLASETGTTFDEKTLHTPSVNLDLGGRYLAKMLRSFNGSIPMAAAAYNAGPRAVRRWLDRMKGVELDVWVALIPFEETRTYVTKVMSNLARYAYLEGGDSAVPSVELTLPASTKEEAAEY
jgi:soluble lytic murein transglycosylase